MSGCLDRNICSAHAVVFRLSPQYCASAGLLGDVTVQLKKTRVVFTATSYIISSTHYLWNNFFYDYSGIMNHLNGDPGGGSVGVPGDVELDTLLPSQRPSVEPSNLASTTNSMRMANVPNSTIVLKPSQTSSALRFSRRTSRSSFWFYEIGAIILSLLFMVAIIVLLSKIDGKPMSSWKLPLSPNTVIAIFSTLSKSAVLLVISECLSQLKWVYFEQGSQRLMDLQIFDDASRGPLGAIHLLVRIRWTAVAASFGALLTLLALAQDAFYQEVYSTYTDDMAQPGEIATIAMARSLDSHLVNMGSRKFIVYPDY